SAYTDSRWLMRLLVVLSMSPACFRTRWRSLFVSRPRAIQGCGRLRCRGARMALVGQAVPEERIERRSVLAVPVAGAFLRPAEPVADEVDDFQHRTRLRVVGI